MKDLVLLVADKNIQFALKGILSRPKALGTRSIDFDFRIHPGRDGGSRTSGVQALAAERRRFSHALLVFDFEGSGAGHIDVLALEHELDKQLQSQWGDDAKAIVIDPEVDVWVWGADAVLQEVLQWPLEVGIREWIKAKGFIVKEIDNKPERPKEAFESLVSVHGLPRSSALYNQITQRISFARCQDKTFARLCEKLRHWFPVVDG